MTFKMMLQTVVLSGFLVTGAVSVEAADRADVVKVIASPQIHAPAYGGPTNPLINANGLLPNGILANAPSYG